MIAMIQRYCLIIAISGLILFSGCDNISAPGSLTDGTSSDVPGDTIDMQIQTVASVDVVSEIRSIDAPVSITSLPAECQKLKYLRCGIAGTRGDGSDADQVLVLMTGILTGNNVMSFMARELVAMAKKDRGLNIEVWVIERRFNNIEDTTGLDEAEKTGDIDVALDYYFNGKPINGKTFGGYLLNKDVPYLAEMGLKLVMDDLYRLITTLVPDQKTRQQKVFVGGHSLGGFLAAFFSGWDFDGDPSTTNDAGYNNCAGIVGLDTIVSPFIELFDPFMNMLPSAITSMIPYLGSGAYPVIVSGLKNSTLPRILPIKTMGFNAETYTYLELIAMLADTRPDEESTLFDKVDYSASVATILKLVHSRSLLEFLQTEPSIEDYRYTNEALLGVLFDDNFMPISITQASMGFLNGPVSKKNFPMPDNLPEIPPLTDLIGILLSGDNMYIANDEEVLYTWNNYNELGAADLEYTSQGREVSDIHTIAKCFYKGPSNMLEWYFPTRLLIDMCMATYPVSSKYGLNYFHGDKLDTKPLFMSLGGDGPFLEPAKNAGIDVSGITAEGYDHFDLLAAATDNPDRPNEVFMPMIDFMIKNTAK